MRKLSFYCTTSITAYVCSTCSFPMCCRRTLKPRIFLFQRTKKPPAELLHSSNNMLLHSLLYIENLLTLSLSLPSFPSSPSSPPPLVPTSKEASLEGREEETEDVAKWVHCSFFMEEKLGGLLLNRAVIQDGLGMLVRRLIKGN